MKSLYFFSLVFILLVMSCEPESPIDCPVACVEEPEKPCIAAEAPIYHPGEMTHGRVAGLKNCKPFMASAISFIGDKTFPIIGLSINTYEDWGDFFANKEFIGFVSKALSPGIYPILIQVDSMPNVNFHYYYTYQDHDVAEDIFRLDTAYDYNRMHLTEVDTILGRVSGWFECRWVIDDPNPSGKHPDTILFTHCYFEAKTQ